MKLPDSILPELADKLRKDALVIEELVFSSAKNFKIDLRLLSSNDDLTKALKAICGEIPKDIPVIYIIHCMDKNLRADLRARFCANRANLLSKGIKLCRDNNKVSDGECLYVGSTRKALFTRLMQHFTENSAKTYALHMSTWADTFGGVLDIELLYCKGIQPKHLQLVEDAIAEKLKPLFGKTGTSGKT